MFIFYPSVTDIRDILRPVELSMRPNSILTEDKQSRSEDLRFKKEFQKLLWEDLTYLA